MKQRPENPILATLNALLGLFLFFLFALIIPWKTPLINLVFLLLGGAMACGGGGLFFRPKQAALLLRAAALTAMGVGILLTLLCLTSMSYLAGIYDGMGKTASGVFLFLIFIFSIVLILLPGLQIYHLKHIGRK